MIRDPGRETLDTNYEKLFKVSDHLNIILYANWLEYYIRKIKGHIRVTYIKTETRNVTLHVHAEKDLIVTT